MIDPQTSKSKAWKHQKEVARLYTEEKLTLTQIGERFGCSKETIRTILKALAVPRDGKPGPRKRTYNAGEIRRLYIEEKLTLQAISKRLKIPADKLSKVLRSTGVEVKPGGFHLIAYPELRKLKIGESLELPRIISKNKQTYIRYYDMAKKAGIRLSVRIISEDKVRVTRKG